MPWHQRIGRHLSRTWESLLGNSQLCLLRSSSHGVVSAERPKRENGGLTHRPVCLSARLRECCVVDRATPALVSTRASQAWEMYAGRTEHCWPLTLCAPWGAFPSMATTGRSTPCTRAARRCWAHRRVSAHAALSKQSCSFARRPILRPIVQKLQTWALASGLSYQSVLLDLLISLLECRTWSGALLALQATVPIELCVSDRAPVQAQLLCTLTRGRLRSCRDARAKCAPITST